MRRIRAAVRGFPDAAMFELRDTGTARCSSSSSDASFRFARSTRCRCRRRWRFSTAPRLPRRSARHGREIDQLIGTSSFHGARRDRFTRSPTRPSMNSAESCRGCRKAQTFTASDPSARTSRSASRAGARDQRRRPRASRDESLGLRADDARVDDGRARRGSAEALLDRDQPPARAVRQARVHGRCQSAQRARCWTIAARWVSSSTVRIALLAQLTL